MGLGVLEDHKLEHVPGTSFVGDDEGRRTEEHAPLDPNLKYDTSGPTPIILVPQPSDDPSDPLNWSLLRRDFILAILSFLAVIASTLSPLLAADSVTLALHYRCTFDQVALLTGYHLLGVGVGGFLFVPSSRVWGKRHTFLIGTIVIIFSSVWGGFAGGSYTSMLWARLFQGIGLAPFEALVNATVGDLYFVHERGKRMALTNFAVYGGAFMTPVIVGKMAATIGWEWSFWLIAIFQGAGLPLLVLFVPETAFRRDDKLNTDILVMEGTGPGTSTVVQRQTTSSHRKSSSTGIVQDGEFEKAEHSSDMPTAATATTTPNGVRHQTPSFKSTLAPFNGRKTDESYWKLLLRPLPLFAHPSIFWACLIQGTLIGWTVFLGIILAAIVLGPPLSFNEVQTGYMYTGAFVGAIVGFALSGLLSDTSAKWMTRRNRGVWEPEFRLVLVIPQLILGCAGLYGFGITANNTVKYGWFWPDFFFALEVAGMVVGAVASALYIVDAHRNISIEAFTCMMVFKNIFSFGLTWSGYHWLIIGGIKKVFIACASVQLGVCLLTVPLYIFGKRNRSFFARNDILKMLGLW
ncbi:putative MFS transporter [Tothia fuscella]|uniref:MFS transporter n=1 Tax=Tothia fuscella TaxID=1048955 RepID=A0A9P4P111_9PEZI|nr:putative MFS transporter [Tothia fuscella]